MAELLEQCLARRFTTLLIVLLQVDTDGPYMDVLHQGAVATRRLARLNGLVMGIPIRHRSVCPGNSDSNNSDINSNNKQCVLV